MWTDAWPSIEIVNLGRSIHEVKRLVRKPPEGQPDEVTRALSRFLVVRSSGYLEQVVRECCLAYISSKSQPQVAAFATGAFGTHLNPKPDRLIDIVRAFDATWAEELEELFDEEDQFLRREVALLVDRRNKIAHGLSEGVTSSKALDLFDAAEQIAFWFVGCFDPR